MGRSPTNAKAKLIQTATDLIWKSSYGSVSVDDICNSSGVKKGSFYYYFSSKAELAVAVMEASSQSHEVDMQNVFSKSISATERFERLAVFVYNKQKQSCEKYGHVCGCPFASLGSEVAGNDEFIRQKIDEIIHRQEYLLIETLKEIVTSDQLPADTDLSAKANEIHAFILGQVMMARIQNDLTNLKTNVRSGLLTLINCRNTEPTVINDQ